MPSPKRRKLQHKPAAAKPTAATESSSFLLSPDAPIIISSYLRVVFHALALFIITVFLCYTVTASKAQIEERITQEIAAMQVEILECKRKYIEYECASSHRLDLFREHCIQWDKCRNRVPSLIMRSKIATQVYGEIVNGLIDPLTPKAMTVIILIVFGSLLLSVFAL